jgi:hypothetical protein
LRTLFTGQRQYQNHLVVVGEPGCSGAATSNQRHRKHPIRHLISWRAGHFPPLKVVGQRSVLNHKSVAVVQQAKKNINVKAVFVNVTDVNCRR